MSTELGNEPPELPNEANSAIRACMGPPCPAGPAGLSLHEGRKELVDLAAVLKKAGQASVRAAGYRAEQRFQHPQCLAAQEPQGPQQFEQHDGRHGQPVAGERFGDVADRLRTIAGGDGRPAGMR